MKYNALQKFGYAVKGVMSCWKEELHMRIHSIAALATIIAGLYFEIERFEWLLISLSIGAVLAAELINSALENLVNLVQPDRHPIAGKVKDMAAGAVLMVSIMAAVIGLTVFWPHICSFFVN